MQPIDTSYSIPPFPAFPSTSRYVPLGTVDDAFTRVCRSIEASEAVSLVVGPPGTGKSLLCALIAKRYRTSHEVVVLGETCLENRDAFLRHLLHHLQVDVSKTVDGDLQLAVIDRVCREDAPEGGLLIIIDEAQSLSAEVLEAIRMVTNIMRDGIPRVSAVVCGGVKLDDLLIEPSMEAFVQRVATRCYLHPMNGEETHQYISETIRMCGADPAATIGDAAIATVHGACSGVPRLVNQLMTQAIDCAEEANQAMIADSIIELAWSQLQQLPSPMIEEPKIASESSSVEFGELDDDFASHSAPVPAAPVPAAPVPAAPENDQVDDIHVETNTAEWLSDCDSETETAEEVEAAHASSSDDEQTSAHETIEWTNEDSSSEPISDESVFGDFEHEEEIAVGSAVEAAPCEAAEEETDIEHVLHQEIIGINDSLHELLNPSSEEDPFFVSGQPSFGEHSDTEDSSESVSDESPESDSEEPEAMGDVTPGIEDDTEESQEEAPKTISSLLWVSEEESATDDEEDAAGRDDSDMLVIEDEVEIQRIDAAKQYDSLDQTISVDFHAMLSRMRQSS